MKEKLEEAKRQLYSLLLSAPVNNLTDNEVDLMFYLAKDEQIQRILNKEK
jgi:hypothetical protein